MTEWHKLARFALPLLDGVVAAICAIAAALALMGAMVAGELPMAAALFIAVVIYAAARLGWLLWTSQP